MRYPPRKGDSHPVTERTCMNRSQADLIERFVAACRADDRVVAAFLGGSLAAGTADDYSDLDLYLITQDEAYKSFFSDRQEFMRRLGMPVFAEDFSEFGFDMVPFIYEDGVYGSEARPGVVLA